MILRSEVEVANTRQKLRALEALYEEIRHETDDDPELREMTLQSIQRFMNQLKEDIERFEAGLTTLSAAEKNRRWGPHDIHQGDDVVLETEEEAANVRRKLRALEGLYEARRDAKDRDPESHQKNMAILKRMINQFKGQIARFEARQGETEESRPARTR